MTSLSNYKAEEFTGIASGATSGIITTMSGFDIVFTLAIAVVTGFLGAFGAHLFKVIINRNKNNEGRQPS